jgi:predicted DNA-binding transcriptional regulator AlpA
MNITIDSKAFKMIMDKLTFLEAAVKAQNARQGLTKYMDEEEVMQVTGLSKRTLAEKRKQGVFTGYTSTGRKIKYLRKEVETYMNGDMADKIYSLKEDKKLQKSA